jgi:hypothetical protein
VTPEANAVATESGQEEDGRVVISLEDVEQVKDSEEVLISSESHSNQEEDCKVMISSEDV